MVMIIMSYLYIKNKEDFENKHPYKNKIKKYPSIYPCVLSIVHKDGGLMGWFYEVDIIENLNDFIHHNGFLYKKC